MQNYKTIIGVLDMRINQKISRDKCKGKYPLGNGTYQLIEERFKNTNITFGELMKMDPSDVVKLIYPPDNLRRKNIPIPDYDAVYSKLCRKSCASTLFLEWMDYKKSNPDGYQYTQYCEYYNRYVKETYGKDITMAQNRVPGEKIYIDWVGLRPKLVFDKENQKLKEAHFYVTTVGVSNMMFVKAYENEKLHNFIDGTRCALSYYGAVPKYLVPDNLKTAVNKHTKDELIINTSYEDLEEYYGTVILPPPSLKPKGKAVVERYVQFVETRIIPELSKETFYSFDALNNKLFELVDESNNEYSKSLKATKKETFEAYDKPVMKPLPQSSFSLVDYKYVSKVPNNYHVEYDNHYYSIPFKYYDKPVIVKASFTEVKIVDENNCLIHKHSRSYKAFPKYITVDEHMPSSHKYWKEINESKSEDYLLRAKRIGPNMEKLIRSVMLSFKHEEQSYNSLNGILHSCDGLSYIICDEVAKDCLESGCATYSYFKKALIHTIDTQDNINKKLPDHNNLRGKDFYK